MAIVQSTSAKFGNRSYPEYLNIGKSFGDLSMEERALCAARLVKALKLLANPCRLRILSELTCGERTVTQLKNSLSRSQPAVSNDLALLSQLGILRNRSEGRRVIYTLSESARPQIKLLLAGV